MCTGSSNETCEFARFAWNPWGAEDWVGNFQGLCCPVRRAGRYLHLRLDGKPLYQQTWSYVGDFREGSAVVHEGSQATHIDLTGEFLHGRWYKDMDVFHKGLARAKDANGWTHIDGQGNPRCEKGQNYATLFGVQSRDQLGKQ